MNKKTGLQVLMFLVIIIISLWFYLKYFVKEDAKEALIIEKFDKNQNNTSTYIDDVDYVSFDLRGNKYQVTAEQAEIKVENPDIMFLTNVISYVFIKNSDTVKITSNFGKYNSNNSDTIFSQNVIVIYPEHKITGEYLDFSFLNNLGTMSEDVIYTGDKTNLFADKIEMDLDTKDTRIFMDQPTALYDDVSELTKVFVEGTK